MNEKKVVQSFCVDVLRYDENPIRITTAFKYDLKTVGNFFLSFIFMRIHTFYANWVRLFH